AEQGERAGVLAQEGDSWVHLYSPRRQDVHGRHAAGRFGGLAALQTFCFLTRCGVAASGEKGIAWGGRASPNPSAACVLLTHNPAKHIIPIANKALQPEPLARERPRIRADPAGLGRL